MMNKINFFKPFIEELEARNAFSQLSLDLLDISLLNNFHFTYQGLQRGDFLESRNGNDALTAISSLNIVSDSSQRTASFAESDKHFQEYARESVYTNSTSLVVLQQLATYAQSNWPGAIKQANSKKPDCGCDKKKDSDNPTESLWCLIEGAEGSIAFSSGTGTRKFGVGDFSSQANLHQATRVFLDTDQNGTILATPDVQRVKLEVSICLNNNMPDQYKVKWELYDPDDPATDTYHLDPNGAAGRDNRDQIPSQADNASHWFMQADHAISGQYDLGTQNTGNENTVIGRAYTTLTAQENWIVNDYRSTVYLHYGDEGGDNYKVRAVLVKGETEIASDMSATITVWRQRTLNVYAMAKQGQSGNYYPSNDSTFNSLKAAFRIAYANQNPTYTIAEPGDGTPANADSANHWAYLDFVFVEKTLNLPYQSPIKTEPDLEWSVYLMNNVHNSGASHSNNEYDVIGVNRLMVKNEMNTYDDVWGYAGNEPHAGVAVGHINEQGPPSIIVPSINRSSVHELGHIIIYEPEIGFGIHEHTGPLSGNTCPYNWLVYGSDLLICTKHIQTIRDTVSRSFPQHNPQHNKLGPNQFDSNY